MKKLASLILAVVFTLSLTLAVVNSVVGTPMAHTQKTITNYATILPIGPPPFPHDSTNSSGGGE